MSLLIIPCQKLGLPRHTALEQVSCQGHQQVAIWGLDQRNNGLLVDVLVDHLVGLEINDGT